MYEDHWMYQHPFFPFLIADVDRFVTLPDGRKAILECKTAHYDMQFKWANGAVPRHYELQVRALHVGDEYRCCIHCLPVLK